MAAPERSADEIPADRHLSPGRSQRPAWALLELANEREQVRALLQQSEEREQQSSAQLREQGTLDDRSGSTGASNRLLLAEELAILDLIEEWASVDRSPRKLAHRGSYAGSVFVSPTTVQRIALKHRITLPPEPPRPSRRKLVFPEVPRERNRIWMWEASPFPNAQRVAYAIVDVVTRYWVGYLLASEQSPLALASVLEQKGMLDAAGTPADVAGTPADAAGTPADAAGTPADAAGTPADAAGTPADAAGTPADAAGTPADAAGTPADAAGTPAEAAAAEGPVLVAWAGNGKEMAAPRTPTGQAVVESFFGHLQGEWPHLSSITDPETLDQELARIRDEYNNVRLHPGIGYVTPADEHQGRGPQIRDAREAGIKRARAERIKHNRKRDQ